MNSRRSFMWKLGAGASATIASTVGMAKPEAPKAGSAELKVAMLEAERALRQLHRAFERAMDGGVPHEVVGLFTEDAEVVFNGGVFQGSRGVARLYREHFHVTKTGRTMPSAPGFGLTADQHRDSVVVSPDLLTAAATFTYSIQVGMPFDTASSLASMARLQGEGVRSWWEGGIYKVAYRRDPAGGIWKISRLEYDALSRADYRTGRSYADPIAARRFSLRYPEDQQGPDFLV